MADQDSSTSPPARRRDGLTALLLIGLVAVALFFGYRPGKPVAAAAPPIAEADDPNLPPGSVIYAAPDGPVDGAYNMNQAMALAGEQLPAGVESYYFFAFTDDAPAEQEIGDLSDKLAQASKEHDFLGIAGPDAERNKRNLLAALRANQGKDLAGVVIIYVGPEAHRDELMQAVQAAGAQFRFVVYPGKAADTKPQV